MSGADLLAWMRVETWAELAWVAVGLAGQMLFTCRFLIQWVASEKARRSVVPVAFWWFSIAGGVVLFSYALYRRDPVFVLGQGMGLVVYGRNLYLIHAARKRSPVASEPATRDG